MMTWLSRPRFSLVVVGRVTLRMVSRVVCV